MPGNDAYFQNRRAEFQRWFREAGGATLDGHGPDSFEKVYFRDFLASFLPRKYGVAAAKLLGKDGTVSRRHGVVVFDALNCPSLAAEDDEREYLIVPAESVISVIEVAPVLDPASIGEMIESLRAAREVPGVKNDAFGGFFAFSPPVLSREVDIIAYINDISNAIVGSEIYTFLRLGCVLPGADHAAVESSTGEVPCFGYHKSRLVHDESVSHRSVKDQERFGDFALTWPDTVFHVFMIGLLENLEKWSFRKYDARDYFAGL
jgi:hypothetical protein